MFSSSIGHPGPFGSPSFLLVTTLLFLLVAFPSAGVVGQSNSTKPKSGPKPRHELFEKAIKGNPKIMTDNAFNYVCLQFDDQAYNRDKGDRMFCGCVPKDKSNWKPTTFHYPKVDVEGCLNDFYRVAMMPMCGNEWFDQMKLCALTQFFGDKKPNVEEIKNDANKKTLLLIDGCALCNSNGAKITKIEVVHTEEATGNIFSNCKEDVRTDVKIEGLNIDLLPGNVKENTTSFSVPVLLYHRACDQVFGYADLSDKFVNIKLKITHNCGGKGKVKEIDLPEVDRTSKVFSKHFVAELRGIQINLESEKVQQFKLTSGNDEMPKYEMRGKPSDNGWENANVNCWMGEQNCKLKS